MRKRFLRKSILIQAIVGGILAMLLLVPSMTGYASHPLLSIIGMGCYVLLVATIGIVIEAKVK